MDRQFVRSIFGHFVVSRLRSASRQGTSSRCSWYARSIPTGPAPTTMTGTSSSFAGGDVWVILDGDDDDVAVVG